MFAQGFISLIAVFASCMAVGGLVVLVHRFNAAERRRRYEVECIIKSLQALEQQNLMLQDRLMAATTPREVVPAAARFESVSATRQAAATEEEVQQQFPQPVSRLLH